MEEREAVQVPGDGKAVNAGCTAVLRWVHRRQQGRFRAYMRAQNDRRGEFGSEAVQRNRCFRTRKSFCGS